jgi:hypothetical protein
MSRRDSMNVKVDAELVRKAKVVAAVRRLTLTEYISELLRPQVESDLAQVAARLAGSQPAAPVPPPESPPPTG